MVEPVNQNSQWPAGGELAFVMDIFERVKKNAKVFWLTFLAGLLVTTAAVIFYPRSYVATTSLLVPGGQNSSASAALAQLGGAAAALGGVSSKGLDDLYVALLGSRRIVDSIAQKFNLRDHYDLESSEEARKKLKKNSSITLDKKSGLITIEVIDKSSDLAVQIANRYVVELQLLTSNLAVTDAKKKRIFLESQIENAKSKLDESEVRFRKEKDASGWVVPQAMAEFNTKTAAVLKSQILETEVQMATMSRIFAPSNPEYLKASVRLNALRRQLSEIESGSSGGSETLSPTSAVKAYRQLKLDELILEGLMRQVESVRLEESKEGALIQQVDSAFSSEKPRVPDRKLIAAIGSVVSVLAALFFACWTVKRDVAAH